MTVNEHRPQKRQSTLDREISKPLFPSARYFQIHFQHMQAQLDSTQRGVETLQQQIAELQARLGPAHSRFDMTDAEK